MERSREGESFDGQTAASTSASYKTTSYKAMARISGSTAGNTPERGIVIKCTERERLNGEMADATAACIKTIKSTVMAFSNGRMSASTSEIGKTASNTDKECTSRRVERAGKASGRMESWFIG